MRRKIAAVLMIVSSQLSAAELEIPKVFVNGEVADATDFNLNNDYLIDKLEEESARTDELLANARWNNADAFGAIPEQIDCTTNQSALIEAYHASVSEDHLHFLITGSCFGAYQWVQTTDDEGQPVLSQVQPKNQVIAISSDKTTNPNNRAKIIPRKITADRDYFTAALVSSFGNGLYLNDLEIEMGADDAYAALYSRSSNGGLTDIAIKGNAEPNRTQTGVRIQNGAAAYIGGANEGKASIEGVSIGIRMASESTGNIYGSLVINAQNEGISTFSGGNFYLTLSAGGKVAAAEGGFAAISLTDGGQGFISSSTADVSIEGDITVNNSSLHISGSTVISDSAIINVWFGSNLKILNDNSGITSDRMFCSGPSYATVNGLQMNNSNGNGCLDESSWKAVIDSIFPPSSASKLSERLSSKTVLASPPAVATGVVNERLLEPSGLRLPH